MESKMVARFEPMARLAGVAVAAILVGCTGPPSMEHTPGASDGSAAAASAGIGADVTADIERVRSATESFRSLDAAVAAGYPREVTACIDNPGEGGMGFHHQHGGLMDGEIEIERPEILVYERMPDGEYRLNGVEYVVPFSAVPETSEPPVVMGRQLRKAIGLGIWYRHVWVWRENPSGMFADWNPLVKC